MRVRPRPLTRITKASAQLLPPVVSISDLKPPIRTCTACKVEADAFHELKGTVNLAKWVWLKVVSFDRSLFMGEPRSKFLPLIHPVRAH
jgi:hypothetical protein